MGSTLNERLRPSHQDLKTNICRVSFLHFGKEVIVGIDLEILAYVDFSMPGPIVYICSIRFQKGRNEPHPRIFV